MRLLKPIKLIPQITVENPTATLELTLNDDQISYTCTKNGVFQRLLCVGRSLCNNGFKKDIFDSILAISLR